MFGYVIANLEGLTQPQKDRYKGCYCGLCRVLKQRHRVFRPPDADI